MQVTITIIIAFFIILAVFMTEECNITFKDNKDLQDKIKKLESDYYTLSQELKNKDEEIERLHQQIYLYENVECILRRARE
jgi:cell division protein FtsB